MKIGVDARMLEASGIGVVIENIVRRLIQLEPHWELYLLGSREAFSRKKIFEEGNVHIVECTSKIYTIYEQFELILKIPKGLDLFWSPHYNVPVFYQGRMLVTIHDVAHLALPEVRRSLLKRMYAKTMLGIAARKADRVMCVSQFTIGELKKYIAVDTKKIELVYNGVDETWFHIPDGTKLHEKPYFVYMGNIKPHKNLLRLIEAYRRVSDEVRHDLVLIGKKEGFITGINNIVDRIKGLEDRIHFTGYVEDDVLKQYVIQSDGLIFPSLYEGFGLPPLEAMAAGKKALISDIPCLKEICGDAAEYCNPYDVADIAEKLKKFEDVEMNPEILRKKAKSYTWEAAAQKIRDIMCLVVGSER